jgi:hypothetical protein
MSDINALSLKSETNVMGHLKLNMINVQYIYAN